MEIYKSNMEKFYKISDLKLKNVENLQFYGGKTGKFPDLLHNNLEIYKSKDLPQKNLENYKSIVEKFGNFQIYSGKIWNFEIQYIKTWKLTNPK